jgi:sarcosine oxidase
LSSRQAGRHCDALVVGCGAFGAAVSYNLAKRGFDVVTLDRYGLGHEHGSSHGLTRIIRLAYYEDPRYVPLLRMAFQSWRELESVSGEALMRVTGGLMIGSPGGELVEGALRSAKEHSIQHSVLTASDVEDKYYAFSLDEEMVAVHEPDAGVLFPEKCIRTFVGLASEKGCSFRFWEPVTSWKSSADAVEVETAVGRYSADRIFLCAGPWNSGLAPGAVPTQCERQVPLWFASGGDECFTPEMMPVFISEEGKGLLYYGVPDLGDGVKVARHHGGEACDPDKTMREVGEDDVAQVREFNSRRLKKLSAKPLRAMTCIYTNTPDMNFAIGRHPKDAKAYIVSACSGHGFKFASVLGEVVADWATGVDPGHDVSFLDLGRFAGP